MFSFFLFNSLVLASDLFGQILTFSDADILLEFKDFYSINIFGKDSITSFLFDLHTNVCVYYTCTHICMYYIHVHTHVYYMLETHTYVCVTHTHIYIYIYMP